MSTIFDGLSLGAIYALIALGYTMVYGIAKMLNFAHGDIIMVGAYAFFVTLTSNLPSVLTELFGSFITEGEKVALLSTICALLISVIVAAVICVISGVVIEKVAYKPLRGSSPLAVLITAIGISYLLQGLAQLIFGADPKPVEFPAFGTVKLFGAQISVASIVTLAVGAVIMIVLTLFVKYAKTGRAMVAVSEDKGAATLMGINVNKIISITFAIGSALAAAASIFYLIQIPSTEPTLGSMPGIKAFTAAVIGGIGSIPGAMVGGILLGVVEKVCMSIPVLSPYTTAIEFGLLIVILLVRPIGLLGKKRREKV
ncbi:MAG: branched-chain amino acid ABC transporter permease [Clostridia bacterium]|nr:branched-chain amino acid ABC transporter permease [Clostridia bacterium]